MLVTSHAPAPHPATEIQDVVVEGRLHAALAGGLRDHGVHLVSWRRLTKTSVEVLFRDEDGVFWDVRAAAHVGAGAGADDADRAILTAAEDAVGEWRNGRRRRAG